MPPTRSNDSFAACSWTRFVCNSPLAPTILTASAHCYAPPALRMPSSSSYGPSSTRSGPRGGFSRPGTQLVVPGGATCTAPDDPAATMRTTAARLLCYLAADARQYRDVLIALHGSIIDPDLQGRFDRYEQFATLVAPNAIRRSPTHHDWTIDGQTRRSRCRGTARRQPRPNTTGSPGTGARMISTSRSSESRATRDPVCVGRLHRIRASAIEQFIESGTVEVSPPRMRPSFGRW